MSIQDIDSRLESDDSVDSCEDSSKKFARPYKKIADDTRLQLLKMVYQCDIRR